MVKRAARLGSNRLLWVPTHYWDSGAGSSGDVSSYCWMGSDGHTCHPFNQASLDAFRDGMARCFKAAADYGITQLHIMPHLDHAGSDSWTIRTWRNGLIFDPQARYGGYSYADIMLYPLVKALQPLMIPGSGIQRVYFALQGEMGATVMRYPQSYQQLMGTIDNMLRNGGGAAPAAPDTSDDQTIDISTPDTSAAGILRLVQDTLSGAAVRGARAQAQSSTGGPDVSIGLTFNFVMSDGSQATSSTALGALWTGAFGWMWGMRPGVGAPQFDRKAVEALFAQCGWIGISAYAPLNGASFEPTALQNSAFNLFDGFQSVGLNLRDIMSRTGAELHYAEFGVGGGTTQAGQAPATFPDQAANSPFWGVQGAYSQAKDPWRSGAMATFRRQFYSKTLQWLAQGTGPTYGVTACFVWCKSSWDVLGVHPETTTGEGSFRDDTVIAQVTAHNARITGRKP